MNIWTQSKDHVFVAAHRGWSSAYPVNTMEAFRAALEIGVDQIETDIHITADRELVLIHDDTIDRTTNGTGTVGDHTLKELRALDAGFWKGEAFAGAQIPTFDELMELVKDHPTITLDVELKEYPTAGREERAFSVCDRVLRMIDDYHFDDRVVINTFSGKLHEYIRTKYGDRYRQHVYYPIKHLGDVTRDPYEYGYCACMFGNHCGMASVEEFAQMRARGVRTWAGASVKDAETVDLALKCEAELITCNNPDRILALLRERGKHR